MWQGASKFILVKGEEKEQGWKQVVGDISEELKREGIKRDWDAVEKLTSFGALTRVARPALKELFDVAFRIGRSGHTEIALWLTASLPLRPSEVGVSTRCPSSPATRVR